MTKDQETLPKRSDTADVQEERVQHLKIPAFMEAAVPGWFAILNAQFILNKITKNKTKFYHTLTALPPDTVCKLDSAVISNEDYDALKGAVSNLYERTKPELFERLISKAHTSVTGRPSLFLAELRDIASKVGVGDELVRHKFLQCVDPNIAAVLAAQDLPLPQLGRLADELLPFMKKTTGSAYMVPTGRPDNAATNRPTRTPSSARPNQPPLGVMPFSDGQRPKVCRAHIYFGTAARTCRPWCQWPNKPAHLRIESSSRPASRSNSPVRASAAAQQPSEN